MNQTTHVDRKTWNKKPEDESAPCSSHCSAASVATNEDIDGFYRYRWKTRFGRHTVYYYVKDGVIQENIANQSSPIREFVGRKISEFAQARLLKDWRFHDDALHQMTSQ